MCDMYLNQEPAELHFMYGKADGNAALARRLYQESYPDRWIVPDMESLRNRIVAGCEEIRNNPGILDRVHRAVRPILHKDINTPKELQHRIVDAFQQMKNYPGLLERIQVHGEHFEYLLYNSSVNKFVATVWLSRLRRLPAGLKFRSGPDSIPAWADYLQLLALSTLRIPVPPGGSEMHDEATTGMYITNHNPRSEELTGARQIHVEAELPHLFRIPRIPSVSLHNFEGHQDCGNCAMLGRGDRMELSEVSKKRIVIRALDAARRTQCAVGLEKGKRLVPQQMGAISGGSRQRSA
ncbi:hypothetical protein ANN_03615 [Periplaneta americana]|uniref:DUF4817 domain-containing protein n=1 Tax=Periplaneta americana TaxID=6978 RepID=A0ABQ8TZC1_PERAM|nr:hypothetical protein ANN_03615 [Periplaneta americana]